MTERSTQNIIFFDAMSTVLICFILLSTDGHVDATPPKDPIVLRLLPATDIKCRQKLGVAVIKMDQTTEQESSLLIKGTLAIAGDTKIIDQRAVKNQWGLMLFLAGNDENSSHDCLDRSFYVKVAIPGRQAQLVELPKARQHEMGLKL